MYHRVRLFIGLEPPTIGSQTIVDVKQNMFMFVLNPYFCVLTITVTAIYKIGYEYDLRNILYSPETTHFSLSITGRKIQLKEKSCQCKYDFGLKRKIICFEIHVLT